MNSSRVLWELEAGDTAASKVEERLVLAHVVCPRQRQKGGSGVRTLNYDDVISDRGKGGESGRRESEGVVCGTDDVAVVPAPWSACIYKGQEGRGTYEELPNVDPKNTLFTHTVAANAVLTSALRDQNRRTYPLLH